MRSKNYTSARLLQRLSLAFALVALLGTRVMAQSFTENFNSVSTLFTSGWAQQNLSTTIGTVPGWFQGNATVFTAYNAPDSSYIGANYNNTTGANTISNWLFTPTRTFSNGDVISFWSRTVDAPSFPDRLEVRMSLNGASVNAGTTATSVGDFTTLLLTINSTLTTTGYPNTWTQYTYTVTGLGAPTSGRVAFRYFVTNGGPSGANSDYIGIDNYVYTHPVAADLEMQIADSLEYTITPEDHQFRPNYTGRIRNAGTTTVNNAFMQVNVYDGLGTQVYTANSAISSTLAPGATANVTVPVGSFLGPDFYTIEYIAKHGAVDGNTANDTLYNGILVDATQYARDNGNVISALGIGAGNGGYLGQQYHLYQSDNLDSILVFVTAGYTGEPMAAVVWDMLAGVPNNIIASTDTVAYTTDSAAVYVLPIHGGPFTLPAGDFVVTFVEFDSTVQLGQTADIFRNNTTWVNWPTSPAGGWASNEFFGVPAFNRPYVIRPILSACPLYTAATSSTQSACGAATGTATVNVSGGPGPFTYLWSNGNTNATATNLAAGNYTVTATDGGGCTVVGTVTVTNPNAPTANLTATPALCNGGNGSVAAAVAGGTAPYTYLWSNSGNTAIINAPAGTYSVTVTDAAGCVVSAGPATVTQPTAVTSSATSTLESSPGANDASATVTASGGTPPYSYNWSNGGTTATINNIGSGAFTVTVTDANGCTSTASVNVLVGIDGAMNSMEYGAYPNPNEGSFKVFVNTTEPTNVSIQIVDMMGKLVYEAGALASTEFNRDVNLRNQAAGFYFVRVQAAGVTRTIKIEVKH